MYLNVISFKNGKMLAFKAVTPFSVDKVAENWNIVTDDSNGHVLSFRGSEIVTIATSPVKDDVKPKKRPSIKTAVTTE